MPTVWAPFMGPDIGVWQSAAASGWSHTIPFRSLGGLVDSLSLTNGMRGNVGRLAIVAHGDVDGQVQLDRRLTAASIAIFEADFQRLRWFLTPMAELTFYSCIAGAGLAGRALLNSISRLLPGRTVVGFTISAETDAPEGIIQTPGRIREAPHGAGSGRPGREGLMTPWHVSAKWSRDGFIVRSPPLEREVGNRCANPNCPGHSSQLHHCDGWP